MLSTSKCLPKWLVYFSLLAIIIHIPATGVCQNTKGLFKLISSGYIDPVSLNITDTIPIEIDKDWIVLKIKVDDKLQKFIWDTGTAYSTINSVGSSTQKAEIDHVDFTDAVGVKSALPLYNVSKLSIGNTVFHDITFMLLDTRTVAGGILSDFSGAIGLDIIDKINWNFNFDKNFVVISSNSFEIKGGKLVRYANYISYDAIGVNIDLPSGKSFRPLALIDFGLPGSSLYLSKEYLNKLQGLKAERNYGSGGVGISGIGGNQTTYTIVDSLNCSYGPSGKNINIKSKIMIGSENKRTVIGNKFFRQYNFARNSTQSSFIFYPRVSSLDSSGTLSKTYGISFNIHPDSGLYVMSMTDNPNFKNKIVRIHDLVEKIGDKEVRDFKDLFAIRDYLSKSSAQNKALRILMKNGATYTLYPLPNDVTAITGSEF